MVVLSKKNTRKRKEKKGDFEPICGKAYDPSVPGPSVRLAKSTSVLLSLKKYVTSSWLLFMLFFFSLSNTCCVCSHIFSLVNRETFFWSVSVYFPSFLFITRFFFPIHCVFLSFINSFSIFPFYPLTFFSFFSLRFSSFLFLARVIFLRAFENSQKCLRPPFLYLGIYKRINSGCCYAGEMRISGYFS